jgi:hypothetical protein
MSIQGHTMRAIRSRDHITSESGLREARERASVYLGSKNSQKGGESPVNIVVWTPRTAACANSVTPGSGGGARRETGAQVGDHTDQEERP